MTGVKTDSHPQRVHPKEGCRAANRALARALACLVLLVTLTIWAVLLSGCNATRATATAPPAPTQQPVDCRTWDACA